MFLNLFGFHELSDAARLALIDELIAADALLEAEFIAGDLLDRQRSGNRRRSAGALGRALRKSQTARAGRSNCIASWAASLRALPLPRRTDRPRTCQTSRGKRRSQALLRRLAAGPDRSQGERLERHVQQRMALSAADDALLRRGPAGSEGQLRFVAASKSRFAATAASFWALPPLATATAPPASTYTSAQQRPQRAGQRPSGRREPGGRHCRRRWPAGRSRRRRSSVATGRQR